MGKQQAARVTPLKSGAIAPARERLLPPAFAIGIAAAMGLCLALMFPREPLRERLLGEGGQGGRALDGPALAYMEAWLRVSPPDAALIAELAEQLARDGRLDDAQTLLARMHGASGEAALPMLRARLDIARQRANAAASDPPARERYRSELRTLLRQAARMPAPASDLIAFAAQARALGADDLELAFYRALACPQPEHAAIARYRARAVPLRSEWREDTRPPPRVRG
ncbi:hypothetical protein N6G02_05910 [Cupriavidus gilardii]|uniref:hypothetical protein n=1 Tax=Cupriavidus gilardii TaxID=82541 RepID=UPI001580AF47|nr:hypothetical protein [Cupriavidus gilardii]MCT9070480.1 hypothetical protein [Cupriavidus gilardii]MCT9115656.1 hypothetical protein [Cupriavidus gilardii]QKS61141.1 hypothetical protein FOB47_04265 [Cupriavidus gilardii]UXC38550.1 hypothetical protein N4G38_16680 [Cupriavidus gilardii]